jgi:O-antigen ligase
MTTGIAADPERGAAAGRADIPDPLRIAAMVAILLVMVVGVDPFHDGTAAANIESGAGGNRLNQILFLAVGAGVGMLFLQRGLAVLRPLATLPILLTLAWFLVVTVTSTEPAVSGRRLISLMIMLAAAAALPLLARDLRQFAGVLGGTALVILIVCYLGLLVVPDLSMHTVLDLREPEHAGSWRGLFAHKNGAGVIMAALLFIGLFCAQAGHGALGAVVAVLAVLFLAFTNARTSMVLAPMTLILSWLCLATRVGWWRRLVLLGPLAALLTVTVGAVLVAPVGELVGRLTGDASFTGRTDIWAFAAENIARRPLTGFGYGAFWENVFYGGGADALTWVNKATDAHNGYLNTTLETGLPGLLLTLWWFVWRPVSDLRGRNGDGRIDATALLFLRIWLFGLLAAVFETILYHATNGLFFLMAMSVFGLRYLTCARLVRGP